MRLSLCAMGCIWWGVWGGAVLKVKNMSTLRRAARSLPGFGGPGSALRHGLRLSSSTKHEHRAQSRVVTPRSRVFEIRHTIFIFRPGSRTFLIIFDGPLKAGSVIDTPKLISEPRAHGLATTIPRHTCTRALLQVHQRAARTELTSDEWLASLGASLLALMAARRCP